MKIINKGGLTFEEIAELKGISPQRAEQILKIALRKMRRELKRKGLTYDCLR